MTACRSVSPSPNSEGWLENLIEDWLTLVNRGVLGPLHQSKAATGHANRYRDHLLLVKSVLREFSSGCFLGALGVNGRLRLAKWNGRQTL